MKNMLLHVYVRKNRTAFFIDNCDIILENDFDDVDDFYSTCAESMERLLKDISKEEEY